MPQRSIHVLAARARQLDTGQRRAARFREQRPNRWAALVEQLGVNALLPSPPLVLQGAAQPAQSTDLQHMRRWDPRLREPALQKQRAQQPRIGAVALGPLLATPQRRDLGRI